MYWPTNRLDSRLASAIAKSTAFVGLALSIAGCSGNDQLLGTINTESDPIRPDASQQTDGPNQCLVTEYPAHEIGTNLALNFTVDRSTSMADPKWDNFVSGLTVFLHSGDPNGTSIGINYFPFMANQDACKSCPPNACRCLADCGCPCDQHGDPRPCQQGASCDSNSYEKPAVEIGPMPQNVVALVTSFSLSASGPTTIRPALRGALDHLAWYAPMHPDDHVVEVLVLGGPPAADCAPSSVNDCAGDAASSNFKTHVITFDYDGTATDPIAQRGGGRVYRIDSRHDDIARRISGVVDDLRRDPHCEYELPSVMGIDYTKVGVEVNLSPPDAGWGPLTSLEVYQVKNRDACNGGAGWYYDRPDHPPDHPTRLIMCDDTCRKIHGPSEASVIIKTGCSPARPPP